MSTCKEDCLCYEAYVNNPKPFLPNPSECRFFKDRSKFIELKLAQRIKHKPKIEKNARFS